jgi:hypothetical protein
MLLGETWLGETSFWGFRGTVVRGNIVRGIDVVPLHQRRNELMGVRGNPTRVQGGSLFLKEKKVVSYQKLSVNGIGKKSFIALKIEGRI